jgi:NADH dehydrogenase
VVIVGGGFGGVRLAIELGKQPQLEVTLVSDKENFIYYPTLYRTATGGSDQQSSVPLQKIFADDPVHVVLDKALSVDATAKTLALESGTQLDYDKLVLALGVVTNYFGIPGLPENAYGIKSIEEAEQLKRHLHAQLIAEHEPDLNYVIVGGGPTGIELAGELSAYMRDIMARHHIRHRAIHIDLVEMMPHLMPRLPKPVGRAIERRLRKLGVRLYLKSKVEGASAEALTVSGKPIRSHTIVWTAGIANNPFFTEPVFRFSGRKKVLVDEFLRAEGHKDIYVIGDNAETPYSGMAQTALHDAEFLAHNFQCEHDGRPKLAYRIKEPIYVTPVGPNWASVLWGDLHLHGRAGWLLRNVADLKAFSELLSVRQAVAQWSTTAEKQDLCPICSAAQPQLQTT